MDGLGLEKLRPRQVLEGDIILDTYTRRIAGLGEEDSAVEDFLPGEKQRKKAIDSDNSRLWPGGIIPYDLSSFLGKQKCH